MNNYKLIVNFDRSERIRNYSTAILIKKELEKNIINIEKTNNGRIISITILINNEIISLTNLYFKQGIQTGDT